MFMSCYLGACPVHTYTCNVAKCQMSHINHDAQIVLRECVLFHASDTIFGVLDMFRNMSHCLMMVTLTFCHYALTLIHVLKR